MLSTVFSATMPYRYLPQYRTSGNQFAIATETLPVITVTAPEESLDYQINNPQLLDEDDITVAHERTITDVIQGFPGVTSGKVSAFGNGALYPRGRRARRSYPGGAYR